ncbi:hypothetical protein A7G45_12160 [Mycolicibacterium llatzerense]|nr:hypothetical protein [Mycolicibacterium llatzerense]
MGVQIDVTGLSKSFGSSKIWEDVTLTIPAGEVSVMLGPSGTGKSVFLKSLIGLLRPERGSIVIDGTNIIECSAKELYEIRKIVMEKLDVVGMPNDGHKFPGEISPRGALSARPSVLRGRQRR